MFKKILALIGFIGLVSVSPVLADTPVHADLSAGYEYQYGLQGVYSAADIFEETLAFSSKVTPKASLFASFTENEINRPSNPNFSPLPVGLPKFTNSVSTYQAGLDYKVTPAVTWEVSGGTTLNNNYIVLGQQKYITDIQSTLKLRLF